MAILACKVMHSQRADVDAVQSDTVIAMCCKVLAGARIGEEG